MPLAVGKDVREWLRGAIIGGKASDVTLKLRGDLPFPFRDGKQGTFEVRGKFREANLRYAGTGRRSGTSKANCCFPGSAC
jgi:uncharacterized protein YhdP